MFDSLNKTQLLLIASTLIEQQQAKADPERTPFSNIALVTKLTQAATTTTVLIPDFDTPVPFVNQPLVLLGKLSASLENIRVTTWEDGEIDQKSFEAVFDSIVSLDPNSPDGNSGSIGQGILDALPPLLKTLVSDGISLLEEFDGQHAVQSPHTQTGNGETDYQIIVDAETRAMNRPLLTNSLDHV